MYISPGHAILNKSYSDVLDKGVDDPMAVEFRATMARYVPRDHVTWSIASPLLCILDETVTIVQQTSANTHRFGSAEAVY